MTDEDCKKINEVAFDVFFGLARQLGKDLKNEALSEYRDLKDEASSEYKVNLIGEMYGRMLMAECLGYNTSDIGSDASAGAGRILFEVESFLKGEGEERGNGDNEN